MRARRAAVLGKFLVFAALAFLALLLLFPARSAIAQPAPPPAASARPAPPAGSAAPPSGSAAPTPAQLAEAKRFFEEGIRFSKQSQYPEALASFQEAWRIAPRASIGRNLGQTHRDMRDYAAAYASYEEVLTRFPNDPETPTTQKALAELEAFTGTIDVMNAEIGAKITIDGKDAGKTPLSRPVRVNIGSHAVVLTKDGFEPLSRTVDIKGHDTIVISDPLVKETNSGRITVSVLPVTAGAIITVDNQDLGPAPAQAELSAGKHVISARVAGMAATPQEVDVQRRGTHEIVIQLAATDALLTVSVTGMPDADISVDNVVVAKGAWEGRVLPGAHSLVVSKEGFTPYTKTLQIKPAEHAVENVALVAAAPPPAPPKPHDWTGGYTILRGSIDFGLNQPTNDISQGIGYSKDSAVFAGATIGGALDLRFGHSFGPAGIELGVFTFYRHGAATVNVSSPASNSLHPGPTPRVDDYDFHTLGLGLELAGRFMPRMEGFRPTAGLGVGIGMHLGFFNTQSTQDTSSSAPAPTSSPSDPLVYFVPRIAADAGILIGSTPGTKFLLGTQLLLEFPGAQQTSVSPTTAALASTGVKPSTAKINVVNGTDVIFGPVIGVQWGE